jgi:hypothetical protein
MTLVLTELYGDLNLVNWAENILHKIYAHGGHINTDDTWYGDYDYDLNLYDTEVFGSGKPGWAFTVYPVVPTEDGDHTTDCLDDRLHGVVRFDD